jgi:hypothetical protein
MEIHGNSRIPKRCKWTQDLNPDLTVLIQPAWNGEKNDRAQEPVSKRRRPTTNGRYHRNERPSIPLNSVGTQGEVLNIILENKTVVPIRLSDKHLERM